MKESFHPEPHNFDSDVARHATDQADLNISDERVKIETETKLATRLVNRFQAPADLKQELIDFIVDFYDITEENALDTVKQASHELYTGMRSFLKDQGLLFTPNGKVDTMFKANQEALTNPETAAGLEKYLQLVDLDVQIQAQKPFVYKKNFPLEEIVVDKNENWKNESLSYNDAFRENVFDTMLGEENVRTNPDVDHPGIKNPVDIKSILKPKPEAEQEERDGKLVYQALEKYKFSTDVEDFFVRETLNTASRKSNSITFETVDEQLLSVADRIKIEIVVGLLKRDFSIDSNGRLTLPEEKKSILHDETIDWNLELLAAANTILKPNEHTEVVTVVPTTPKPTEDTLKENSLKINETINSVTLEQELQNLDFSNEAIAAAQNPELISLMAGSTIEATGNKQRGLKGFEQIISRAILDLQQKGKFTLDSNNEPVPEGLLQKSLFFFNKTKQINKIKNSPEYAQLRSLIQLKTETEQKMRAEIAKNSSKRTITETTPVPKEQKVDSLIRRSTLPATALAGAAAGILAGTALYKNQETDALERFDENTLVVPKKEVASKKQTSPTFSPRFEETDSTQPKRPLSEAPTVVDVPVVTAREAEPASTRTANETIEEAKPIAVKKSTFKKPTSFGSKQAPKRFKIDPFTYQDTDPTTAPKLERPADDSDYEEAPDLDNPPAYHKRLVEKTFKKPTPITKETVRNTTPGKPVPRQKESPYLATPSVSGTVKGPEEKVKPELRLQKTNTADKTKIETNKLPKKSITKDNTLDTEQQEIADLNFFNQTNWSAIELDQKFNQIADLDALEERIKSGAITADLALLPNYEKKLYADIENIRPAFEAQKNQALQIGEKILTKVIDAEKLASNKTRAQRLNSRKQLIAEGIETIQKVEKKLKNLDDQAKRRLEAYPVLKPVPRQKESPYFATPSVPGTVKDPEEKVNPEFGLDNKLEPYPVLKPIKKKPGDKPRANPNVAKAK